MKKKTENMINFISALNVIFLSVSTCCHGFDNIAINKTLGMFSAEPGFKGKENRAVDGNRNQSIENCTHLKVSYTKNLTYVYVDHGFIGNIYNVTINYRKNSERRLKGYALYYYDESNREGWKLCYKDDPVSDKQKGMVSHTCKGKARYVIVYQRDTSLNDTTPFLEICKIEILGCNSKQFHNGSTCVPCVGAFCDDCDPDGKCLVCMNQTYGNQCEKNCSESCVKGCNVSTGQCGKCSSNKYGIFCNETCGKCRKGPNEDRCNDVTGTCVYGCRKGFTGSLCKEGCNGTSFGFDCNQTCSKTCKFTLGSRLCDSSSGHCTSCVSGKRGKRCKKECMSMMYGENCAFKCGHCLTGSGCDSVSGACAEGCEPGYQGFYCNESSLKLDNIALNKTFVMMSVYPGYEGKENRAVDGNRNQSIEYCTHTDANHGTDFTFVYVDLGSIVNIYNVTIFIRKNFEHRFHGYTLYYSEKIDQEQWKLCYKDDPVSDKQNAIVSNVCKGRARYVIVYQNDTSGYYERPILEICEIEIFGCNSKQFSKGGECVPCIGTFCVDCDTDGICLECINQTYGTHCEKKCSESCVGGCNINTGQCEKCNSNQFGFLCNETCGQCKKGPNEDICDGVTGTCVNGCEKGFTGRLCNEECNGTSFGYNCNQTCRNTCKLTFDLRQCNSSTGHCTSCVAGKRGEGCTEECMAMTYGENCALKCGFCLAGLGCDTVSGACAEGCDTGYQGFYCNEKCMAMTYGENCALKCGHCLTGSGCDSVSGACAEGCDPGYQGFYCNESSIKLDNIALNKTFVMMSVYPGYEGTESRVVDGNRNQSTEYCTHTDPYHGTDYTYVYIDLGNIANIYNVRIYFRKNFEHRFHGYTLYYSEKIDQEQWKLCYKDDPVSDKQNAIVSNVCKGRARYVIVYQNDTSGYYERPILEICEIEIFGCYSDQFSKGGECVPCTGTFCVDCDTDGICLECMNQTYGAHCEKKCPEPCAGECNIRTGQCEKCMNQTYGTHCEKKCSESCVGGCNIYTGQCEKCTSKQYGYFCNETCGQCREGSNNDRCDDVTGTCVNGCEKGFTGRLCNEECNGTSFGYYCYQACSSTCKLTSDLRQCNSSTGHCTSCIAGKRGELCTEECMTMTYGENCALRCGHCLAGSGCDSISGACSEGCDPGYQGFYCNETCNNKTFGRNCSGICGHCRNDTVCDPFSGSCDSGCVPGYQGLTCTETCGLCRNNTDCDQFNGTCLNGCQDGYQGEICNETCNIGYFGEDCHFRCNEHCAESTSMTMTTCHHVTGECLIGCKDGWIGKHCETACFNGTFGKNCAWKCNEWCAGESQKCDPRDGLCINGCIPGFSGSHCNMYCDQGSYGERCLKSCGKCFLKDCHHITGHCAHSEPLCEDGYRGEKCDKECEPCTFGPDCRYNCSNQCFNGKCILESKDIKDDTSQRDNKEFFEDFLPIIGGVVSPFLIILTIITAYRIGKCCKRPKRRPHN